MRGDARRPKFAREQPFRRELERRVGEHFARTGQATTGGGRMLAKAIVLLLWLAASYALLVFVAGTWWQAVLAGMSLALAIAGVGMGIHHDANHGAFSHRAWVNRLFRRTLDGLGVSSYNWSFTHNVFHHTYTNIAGVDQDIDLAPIARLAPGQSRHALHTYQHLYMWLVYGFTLFYFVFVEDFVQLHRAHRGPHSFPPPRGGELWLVFGSKLFMLGWSLVFPLAFHAWWVVVPAWLAIWLVAGFVLGFTFQVAHCGADAVFPDFGESSPPLSSEWAAHQVLTTADFARSSRWVTWFVGGLNYQIEHHLFPKICHIHYPAIAPIVERTCRDFGLPYTDYAGVGEALRAHARWLRQMGGAAQSAPGDVARAQGR